MRAALVLTLLASPLAAQEVEVSVMTYNLWYGGVQVDFAATIEAIRLADADIVGLQEPDGITAIIAAAAGYPYVDLRRHIISRLPLFDSGIGTRTGTGQAPYSMVGLDVNAVFAWAMVAPGQAVGVANLHLTSDPYGPDVLSTGGSVEDALAAEAETRMPEIEPFLDALDPVVADGIPVFVTGDFNSPSHLDWTDAAVGLRPASVAAVAWPVSAAMMSAGFEDSFRAAHPDPVARPGLTYSPGFPHPIMEPGENHDRIDFVYASLGETLESLVVGEAGNPDVDIAVTPWPSDHRAVVSRFSVVPVEAPALVAVEPRLVSAGDTFLVRVNVPGRAPYGIAVVPAGGDPATDTITSATSIEAYWLSALRLSTLGLAPASYDAVLLDEAGAALARTRFSVVAEDGRATLSVLAPEIVEGEVVQVAWTGAPGFRFDWIGIYEAGDPDLYAYLAFAYTGATLEGEMTLTPDVDFDALPSGDYEVRLMADDHYAVQAVAPFTVTGPPMGP